MLDNEAIEYVQTAYNAGFDCGAHGADAEAGRKNKYVQS